MRAIKLDRAARRIACMAVSIGIAATLAPYPGQVAMAADPIDTMVTSYQPVISESIDANGFKHPGVGLTKEALETMRTQVLAKKEPWNTHFNMMLKSGKASRTVGISNVNGADPTQPRILGIDSQGANGLFINDALTAYTQAILYYVTGDDVYRANAMRIIRLYGKMDPSKYVYFVDSHIHTGIPLSRMTAAAEILRYTSTQTPALAWTDDDTVNFSRNLVTPVIQTFDNCNCRFMNQHLYTTIAKMSGSIFMGDRDGYNEAVEWFTVNKDAPDPAWTGSIKQLFRTVTRNDATGEAIPPQIQHVEMGRDQAHGAGDLTNSEILARLMMAQGTKVDPAAGTPSTASNAVGPYEFMDDRLLAVHELWGKYMIGYDIPWVPVAMSVNPDGSIRAMYNNVNPSYRGRLSQNTWEAFYYYKYVRGIDLEQLAPGYTTIYAKRKAYNWDGVDGGGDFWLTLPKAAEAEGSKYLGIPIVDPYREVEDRFTAYDGNAVAQTEGTTGFVRTTATPEGTRIAVYSYNGAAIPNMGFRIRTSGQAMMDVDGMSLALPNTRGQWRYVVVPLNLGDFLPLKVTGAGTTVDIDHINVKSSTLLSPPVFKSGTGDTTAYTYAGATIPVTLDLSATDPAAGDVVTYNMDNLPQGATFDTSTGAFSWQPTQAGTYTFIAEASDGTSVTTKRVIVDVAADRQAAVATVAAPFKPDTQYVTATKTAYESAYADMQNTIGSGTDDTYFQKLGALRNAVSGLRELTPLLKDGSLDYTNLFFKTNLVTNFGDWAANGVDDNTDSFIAFTIARDTNHTFTLDFGPSFKVAANKFQLQPRTSFPERVGGVTIFGSNDNENWTRISPDETLGIEGWQTLNVADEFRTKRYRFFKLSMIHDLWTYNILELGEFRIFGTRYETVNKLTSVSLGSDQALKNRVVPGNTIKLTFQSSEPINNVSATIQGEPASITTTDNLNWTATTVVDATMAPGPVKLLLNYRTADGTAAEPVLFTTDSSTLSIADQKDYIDNVLDIATVTDSNGRNATDVIKNAKLLFDSNLTTNTDLRLNGSGNNGWVKFDFRPGVTTVLSRVDVIGPQNQYSGRINGTVVQGSNDNATWTNISTFAGNTPEWQSLKITGTTPYRYIRMTNANAWFGNMTELRLYGTVNAADTTAPSTTATAPQGMVTTDATITFAATDNQGGSGVAATYYTVDGGARQTGNTVTLTTSGTHTVSYWSTDWAGNTEQAHAVTVSIDKSADVTSSVSIARSGLTVNRFTNKYTGTVTITNTGGQPLTGPLHLRLQALTAGVTLDTQTGVKDGVPYMALPVASLAAGQSVTLTTTFSNPNKAGIAYTPALFSIQ
ncbi:OmpL47-type beta-barrel domain-containing protein [Massilia cellulosiltytica]|uniref:OmpL47-type beta-barrel domain-containing protein n=1 Tax=Massilia cellulosiltytica TaxID=2683234 RepID=UPI0039B3CE5D